MRAVLALVVSILVSCSGAGDDPGSDEADVNQAVCPDPTGDALTTHAFGDLKVSAFGSGHLAMSGPGRGGSSLKVAYAPLAAQFGNQALKATIAAAHDGPDGLDLDLSFGARAAKATVRARADGVVRVEVTDWGGAAPTSTIVSARTDAAEHFYGFGEKFNQLDQAGKKVGVLTLDHPAPKGDASYKVSPWFVSSKGYGFHLDSTAESAFDMRASSQSCWTATNKYKTLAYNLVWGPDLTTVVGRYTGYNGRPAAVPYWGFGPWLSSDVWKSGGEVRMVVETMRRLKIPGSVFVFDSPWAVSYNDFSFNMKQFGAAGTFDVPVVDDATGAWNGSFEKRDFDGFASMPEMMQFLKSNGYRVVVWLTPFVNTKSFGDDGVLGQNLGQSPTYDDGVAKGVFVKTLKGDPLSVGWWKGVGSPIDFTNPDGRAWFTAQLSKLVADSGGVVSGFKTDDGESKTDAPMPGQNGIYIPDDARYADGRTGQEMKNGHTLEYQKTIWSVLGDKGLLLARSGFAGTQAFPGVWAGDNASTFDEGNGLPTAFVAAQSAAMSGYAMWGSDIGGYLDSGPVTNDTPSAQDLADMQALFMRWTELGAVSPVMQLHRQTTHNRQYAWSFGQAGLDNYRAWATFHTQLAPYMASMYKVATDTGVPIVRPLVMLDPDNAQAAAVRFVFGVGSELVAAPVNANVTTRNVTMPSGTWFDVKTGAKTAGGQISVDAPLGELPLYVREGGIVPMHLDAPATLNEKEYVANDAIASPTGGLSVLVVPSATARSLTMYDGTTIAIVDASTITVDGPARDLELKVLATATTADAGGVQATVTQDGAFARVRLAHPGGAVTVHLSN
jgi:alpha-D-xyloside xylohydrolase